MPLTLDLCTDPVAEVRIAAIGQLGQLVSTLVESDSSSAVAPFLDTVCGLASMHNCYKRASFVMMCNSLIPSLEPHIVIRVLLPHLQSLVADGVAIVRLAVARLVRQQFLHRDSYNSLPVVVEMCNKLREDADRDVRGPASL